MERRLARQQLYDMIWERAPSKVAPELGLADVAFMQVVRQARHTLAGCDLLGAAPRGTICKTQAAWPDTRRR